MKNGKARQVLVAGGAGFVGSHLCDALLAEGHHVVCLDSFLTGRRRNIRHLYRDSRFDLVEADVVEPLPPRLKRRFDYVYNLACPASPPLYQADPEHTLLTSVLGTRNLLHLCEDTGARLLMASTSEIYGDPEVHPQVESYRGCVNTTGPRACYDEGKRAAETLCFDFERGGRAEVRVARIFNTYGPRLDAFDGRVVSNVITQALAGDPVTIYGDGRQTRSFCYVDDLVDGLMRLMTYEGPPPGPVNLGNPTELTINELVERVLRITDSGSPVTRKPLPVDDPTRRRPDVTRAREVLGWSAKTPVDEGLRRTVAWFEEEREREEGRREDTRTVGAGFSERTPDSAVSI
ncbi:MULTISPECIES: UDP-glucuronic acid decarboxylase family protein [unclassified Caulobacter]|uniref:UDP-glucuronic acid decarboxylase family protein n=1 Tax=unclassified Caulobacter TaxID=2648921 RepID=UPI0013CC373D|nr:MULTISPECIES: UDP-glucuronic acid decarboxylase family protein [unclassified Caulobacter]MBC6983604.1 SDR family oxidoreductase [Caulobacter sp. 17J80-11]NEX93919.1 SDR family oxidoreductase [Caulobacter sp. 17J65-9]